MTRQDIDTAGTATIIRADARTLPLADNSVDLIVTSPPYFGLRSYQDGGKHYAGQIGDEPTPSEFVDALVEVTGELIRVLRPPGSLWVNLGDKYCSYEGNRQNSQSGLINASLDLPKLPRGTGLTGGGQGRNKSLFGIPWRYALRCTDDLDLILRAEVIWSKPNGLPESVTDRVRRSHETWFHFTTQPRYYANIDPIRIPHTDTSAHAASRRTRTDRRLAAAHAGQVSTGHDAGKLPPSVWEIPTEPLQAPERLGVDHFAAFPTEWPLRIIQGWSPEGGVVLDPFGGTGTTALVARALGRHGIATDLSADYCRLADWRTNDRDQLAKVLGVAKAVQQDEHQEPLFG